MAAGTYKPSYESTPGSPRTATFQLKSGVALYGGFDPSIGDTDWDDRDWTSNVTILSGDLGIPGTQTDNSYHVFYHPAQLSLDATAVLDGFVITAGYANATSPHNRGGGMDNEDSSPTVIDCTFSDNSATQGGGMANYGSSPTVTNCTFSDNSASYGGGGMYNMTSSSPSVTSCIFSDNSATSGGGMGNWSFSEPTVTNCTFSGNSGTGNINADPTFEDPGTRDFDLLAGSPCIDAGTNIAPNLLPPLRFRGRSADLGWGFRWDGHSRHGGGRVRVPHTYPAGDRHRLRKRGADA